MVDVSRRTLLALGPLGVVGATVAGRVGLGLGRPGPRKRARMRREQADSELAMGKDALAANNLDEAGGALGRAYRLYERTETLAKRVGCGELAEYAAVRRKQADYLGEAASSLALARDLGRSSGDPPRDQIRTARRDARRARQKASELAENVPESTDCT